MSHLNPKNKLQEYTMTLSHGNPLRTLPRYHTHELKKDSNGHNGFQCQVTVGPEVYTGYGANKKEAEMDAAEVAYLALSLPDPVKKKTSQREKDQKEQKEKEDHDTMTRLRNLSEHVQSSKTHDPVTGMAYAKMYWPEAPQVKAKAQQKTCDCVAPQPLIVILVNGDTTSLSPEQLRTEHTNVKIFCVQKVLRGPRVEKLPLKGSKALDFYLVKYAQNVLDVAEYEKKLVQIYLISEKLNFVYQEIFKGSPVVVKKQLDLSLLD